MDGCRKDRNGRAAGLTARSETTKQTKPSAPALGAEIADVDFSDARPGGTYYADATPILAISGRLADASER